MKSAPNYRRWIVPGGWILTAAAAFSIGRMSSFLEEPIVPANQAGVAGAGGSGANAAGGSAGGPGETRVGIPTSLSGDNKSLLSVAEVTGGQPLEDWLKKLLEQDDEIYRLQNFMKLFDALHSVEDVKMALKVMAPNNADGGRGGRGMRFTEYSMLLQKLTQLDPKEAVAYASGQNGGERFMATGTVLRTWAKTEPEAALAWAKENGTPQDPNADENDRRGNDNWALASVITQMGKTSLDRALQEAATGDLGRTAGRAADSLLNEAIDQRGIDGAKKIADSLPEGQFRNDYMQQLAGRLAKDDPAGTVAWALSMPDNEARPRLLQEIVDEGYAKDPTVISNLVSRLPVAPGSDGPRREFAQKVAQTNPDAALQTIAQISDPESQVRTVRDIADDLRRRKDVATAQAFVAASTIQDDLKTQIAQGLTQRNRGGGPGGFGGFGGPGGGGFRRGN